MGKNTAEHCVKLVLSHFRILEAVVTAKGYPTKYSIEVEHLCMLNILVFNFFYVSF